MSDAYRTDWEILMDQDRQRQRAELHDVAKRLDIAFESARLLQAARREVENLVSLR